MKLNCFLFEAQGTDTYNLTQFNNKLLRNKYAISSEAIPKPIYNSKNDELKKPKQHGLFDAT
jgi:hypothetical protein